jgi:hypothetical protein
MAGEPETDEHAALRLLPVVGTTFPIQQGTTPLGSNLTTGISAGGFLGAVFSGAPVELLVGAIYTGYGAGALHPASTTNQAMIRRSVPGGVDALLGARFWIRPRIFFDATSGISWTSSVDVRDVSPGPRGQPPSFIGDVPASVGYAVSFGVGVVLVPWSRPDRTGPEFVLAFDPIVRTLPGGALFTLPLTLGVSLGP